MKRILVVVDMQNDFISGSLGTKEAQLVVPKVIDKIRAYRESSQQVFFTRDTHGENYMDTAEGKKLPVQHCIRDTWGWEIEDQIKKEIDDEMVLFDKLTFGSVALGERIRSLVEEEPDLEVELVGLCTDICVISNALLIKAFVPEITIKVDAKCCAGVTPESHKNALLAMTMCQIEIEE